MLIWKSLYLRQYRIAKFVRIGDLENNNVMYFIFENTFSKRELKKKKFNFTF